MIISLPESLRSFVEGKVAQGGYATGSEYVRALIRKDQERTHLRDLLLAGAESLPAVTVNAAYLERLRQRVRRSA